MAPRIALAAPNSASVDAGMEVALAGGNAVDVAVAALATAVSTEPAIVTPMGGAHVVVQAPNGPAEVIDGGVAMAGAGRPADAFGQGAPEVWTGYGGGVTMHAGAGSVATPGTFPALALAMERHGSADWADVLAPAARACRTGYTIGSSAEHWISFCHGPLYGRDDEARAVVSRPDGTPLRAGDVATNHALADTLDVIARDGVGVLTEGEVGRALVDLMDAQGGLITAADLTAYEPLVRDPVVRRLGDWSIAINPPPSVGGPMLAAMLGELARHRDWTWAEVIRIQRAVLSYRYAVHDHSADLETDGHALLTGLERHGLAGLPTSASTVHVSTVDTDGLACAVTASTGYSSGVCIPGTGLVLNNSLGEIELNRRGLHAQPIGSRLASNMAPSVGRTDDGRVLAIGSPGADRITTALMQVLGRACLQGAGVQDAIDAPRVHVRVVDESDVVVEYERDAGIAAAVADSGLPGREHPEPSMYFGGVGAAYLDRDGAPRAAGDPRRASAVGTA